MEHSSHQVIADTRQNNTTWILYFVIYGAFFFYLLKFIPLWDTVGFIYVIPLLYAVFIVLHMPIVSKKMLYIVGIMFFLIVLQMIYRWGGELELSLKSIRVSFGYLIFFCFFYLYFRDSSQRMSSYIPLFLKIILMETILEFILINTFISPEFLPQNPDEASKIWQSAEISTIFGNTYRILGIGGYGQVTGPLIVSLLMFYYGLMDIKPSKIYLFLSLIAIYLCGSGSGYLTLLVTGLLYLTLNKYAPLLFLTMMILATLLLTFWTSFDIFSLFPYSSSLRKISPEYIVVLFSFFMESLKVYFEHLARNPVDLYFGNPLFGEGDSAFLGFFKTMGLIPFLFYILSFTYLAIRARPLSIRKKNFILGLFALCVGTIHYHVLFAIPAQMLLGGLFAEGLVDRRQTAVAAR